MVSGPTEACGIGKAVKAQHHPVAACQDIFQALKAALMDESLIGSYKAFLVRNGKRHIPESGDIVGNKFPFIAVASGGAFHKFPVLVNEFYGQTVQIQHEQGCVFLQEGSQFAHHLGFAQ